MENIWAGASLGTFLFTIGGVIAGGIITWVIGAIHQEQLLRQLPQLVQNKERVSLNEEFLLTRLLANKIRKGRNDLDFSAIISISPGGGMISEWLARREFGNREKPIPVISLPMEPKNPDKFSDGLKISSEFKFGCVPENFPDGDILLINDINRTGDSLTVAHEFIEKYVDKEKIIRATLICHKDAHKKPDYYAVETENKIRFEWKSKK